jgi:hypothetical protein
MRSMHLASILVVDKKLESEDEYKEYPIIRLATPRVLYRFTVRERMLQIWNDRLSVIKFVCLQTSLEIRLIHDFYNAHFWNKFDYL